MLMHIRLCLTSDFEIHKTTGFLKKKFLEPAGNSMSSKVKLKCSGLLEFRIHTSKIMWFHGFQYQKSYLL